MALNLCWIPAMERRRNPFVPGAGLQPPELAGRDRLLENAAVDMDRVLAGRPAKGLILLGLRGVGKTVLLNRLRTLADDKGFRTVRIEAPEGSSLPELLTPELRRIVYALDLRRAAGHRLQRAESVKGMVWSQRHGETAFTVPMFDAFMKRQMPELIRHVPQRQSGRKFEGTSGQPT